MSLMDAGLQEEACNHKSRFLKSGSCVFKPRSRLVSGSILGTAGISYRCSSLSMGMDCIAVNYCIGSGPCSLPMPR